MTTGLCYYRLKSTRICPDRTMTTFICAIITTLFRDL